MEETLLLGFPACAMNEQIQVKNKITTNYDYRQYLINNALKLIQYNATSSCDQCSACLGLFNKSPLSSTAKTSLSLSF